MDLWGRLSNPRPVVETLAEQGSVGRQRPRRGVADARTRASECSSGVVPEEEGRLSTPVQRRLSEAAIDDIVRAYIDGASIDSLAASLDVNRTTIISHVDRRGIGDAGVPIRPSWMATFDLSCSDGLGHGSVARTPVHGLSTPLRTGRLDAPRERSTGVRRRVLRAPAAGGTCRAGRGDRCRLLHGTRQVLRWSWSSHC